MRLFSATGKKIVEFSNLSQCNGSGHFSLTNWDLETQNKIHVVSSSPLTRVCDPFPAASLCGKTEKWKEELGHVLRRTRTIWTCKMAVVYWDRFRDIDDFLFCCCCYCKCYLLYAWVPSSSKDICRDGMVKLCASFWKREDNHFSVWRHILWDGFVEKWAKIKGVKRIGRRLQLGLGIKEDWVEIIVYTN